MYILRRFCQHVCGLSQKPSAQGGRFLLNNIDELSFWGLVIEFHAAFLGEFYRTVFECEESMVFAHSNILAREDHRTALTHQNKTCLGIFSVIEFSAEIFWV